MPHWVSLLAADSPAMPAPTMITRGSLHDGLMLHESKMHSCFEALTALLKFLQDMFSIPNIWSSIPMLLHLHHGKDLRNNFIFIHWKSNNSVQKSLKLLYHNCEILTVYKTAYVCRSRRLLHFPLFKLHVAIYKEIYGY